MPAAILRYAAFTDRPDGGNPAGVVPDATGLREDDMLAIARELGYSETAFLWPQDAVRHRVRYFSPLAEVPFCGHATIAAAVALADAAGPGPVEFHTLAGTVPVETRQAGGQTVATLTSVEPQLEAASAALVEAVLAALRWSRDELDPALPPGIGYAGARHLILATASRDRLARLDYDFDAAQGLCAEHGLTTLALVWRESGHLVHARNPFPAGGIVEDPATGAAAAALGGYLRALGQVNVPCTLTVRQGEDMGRPSRLTVDIGERGGIRVSGTAVRIPAP